MRYSTRMVIFTFSFTIGVWLLQQQAVLPGFGWAWLPALPLALYPAFSRAREYGHMSRFTIVVTRAFLLATFAFGLGFYNAAWQAQHRLSVSLPDDWQGRDIKVTDVVAELPRKFQQGFHFNFDVDKILTPHADVPEHIYLSIYRDRKYTPLVPHAGERWQFTVRLMQPHGSSNPYGFDFELRALENNVRAMEYVNNKADNKRLSALGDGFNYRIESWREAVRDKFNAVLGSAPYAGVLSALAIGDQSSIPGAQWRVFTRTGVNQLMSI